MIISNVVLNFEMLEKAMDLPEGVKIIGLRDNEPGTHFIVRMVSSDMPVNLHLTPDDSLTKVGFAYRPGAVSNIPKDSSLNNEDVATVDVIKSEK
jgi:hypothetical protein